MSEQKRLPIGAVLFDLDGTLTNTLDDICIAVNKACEAAGIPGWSPEECCYLIGDGVRMLARRAVRDRLELIDFFLDHYQAYYSVHSLDHTRPYEGIPELLDRLRQLGIKVTVFTNKPHDDAVHILKHVFPDFPFDVVRGQLPGTPVKPAPDGALAVAEAAGTEPSRFAYLGDSGVDMRCAAAAGMQAFGVLWGFRKADELLAGGAGYLLSRPLDLIPFINADS